MPGTNKTEKVELNQYVGGDHYKRDDYNADMLKIDNAFKDIGEPITPGVEGTVLSITTSSKLTRIPLKITSDVTGGAITIVRNGAAAKPLKLPNGEIVTELVAEIMFYEIYEDEEAFYLAPKNGGVGIIEKIQRGYVNVSGGIYDLNIQSVDLSRSIILIDSAYTPGHDLTKEVLGSVKFLDDNTLRFSGPDTGCTQIWQVIEFQKAKSIQRGTLVSENTGVDDITIEQVDTSKAIVVISQTSDYASADMGAKKMGQLYNSTTLRIRKHLSFGTNVVEWTIIEFD